MAASTQGDEERRIGTGTARGKRTVWLVVAGLATVEALGFSYNSFVTDYMRYRSTSVVTDLLLRLGYFGFMVLGSFMVVLTVDEVFLGGHWRRAVLSGQMGERLERGLAGVRRGLFRDYSPHMALVFLVALGLHYVGFNVANGWFDPYYRREGYWLTALRSDDERQVLEAIEHLAMIRGRRVDEALVTKLDHADGRVRVWLVWALGYRAARDRLTLSDTTDLESRLLDMAESGDWTQRAVVAVALARLGSYSWMKLGLEGLRSPRARDFCIAFGLARDRRPEVVRALGRLVRRAQDEDVRVAAAWALGAMRSADAGRAAAGIALPAPPRLLCVVVDAVRWAKPEVAEPFLMRLFGGPSRRAECRRQEVALRPDARGDKLVVYDPLDPEYRDFGCGPAKILGVRILQVLGWRGRREVLPWLRRQTKSDALSQRLRNCAASVYAVLLEGQR